MKHLCYRQIQLIFMAFVLISLVSLTACSPALDNSTADSIKDAETIVKETPKSDSLPDSVAQAVLQDISRRSNRSQNELRIVNAEPRNWPDGCLGLATPDTFCTQMVVSGWEVTAEGGQQNFVYRTNDSGSIVKIVEE